MSERTWHIYILRDPITSSVRYVGWSLKPSQRLHAHISNAKRGDPSHKARWIRTLISASLLPAIETIESGSGNWQSREQYWIRHYRHNGCDLTNMTDGGEGTVNLLPSAETRAKMAKSHLGRKQTPESTAKTVAALRGRKQSPEHIAKLSLSRKGKTPQRACDAAAIANRGRKQSAEHIRRRTVSKPRPQLRRLSDESVIEIRSLRGSVSQRDLATRYGIGATMVHEIQNLRRYADVSPHCLSPGGLFPTEASA